MAQQNWGVPPPPPPPPGPPPPSGNPWKQAPSQSVQDKNAAYLARMRAKQAATKASEPTSDFDHEPKKKINLFGGDNDALNKAKIANHIIKKKDKYVQLPNTGLSEHQLFQKYKIESTDKIGAGAFARIKIIKDKTSGNQYALKMVKKKGKSISDIEAFKKEILYLSKLTNHPNIIKMYDFCDSQHGLYMVLEYCNGGDVMQKLEQCKTFKEYEAKHLTKQIVAGICYFHQYNIVHRDLKLDNLMFSNGVLKIIDFGLAGDCTHNPLNTPCGTLHFTAPEVLSSYDYTTKADMWSLGVIIYMFICGFPPFFDNQGNEQRLYQLIKRGKFQFIPIYFDECDASIKDLINNLLIKAPAQRLTAQEARNHEWFTGIKAKPKPKQEVINPFLDKKDDGQKQTAPYQKYNQQQQIQQYQNQYKQKQQQQQQQQQQMQPGGGASGFNQNQQKMAQNQYNPNNMNQYGGNMNMNMNQQIYGGQGNNMNNNQYGMQQNMNQYGGQPQQQQQQQFGVQPGGGGFQLQYNQNQQFNNNQYQQQPGGQ